MRKPVDLDRRSAYLLKRVDAAFRARMDQVLRPLGLSVPQYACLEVMQAAPGVSISELARRTFVTRQAAHQVTEGLVAQGLVERGAPQGRAQPLSITADGSTLLDEARVGVMALEALMVEGFTAAEQDQLRSLLERSAAVLERDD